MGVINVTDITDGTTADADDVNSRLDIIVDEFNGNIDNANIKSLAAIDGSKLADGSIPRSKLETPVAFHAHIGASNQTISASTFTKAELDTEEYDLGNNFDSTTNHRFVAPAEGLYQFDAHVGFSGSATRAIADLRVNGQAANYPTVRLIDSESDLRTQSGTVILKLAASDYVELWCYLTGGTELVGTLAGASEMAATRLTGRYLGPTV